MKITKIKLINNEPYSLQLYKIHIFKISFNDTEQTGYCEINSCDVGEHLGPSLDL